MFHSDQPIKNLTEDLFGRNFFAEAVANAILSYQREDSVSIGLFGEWGSGKTSIINMMVEKIRSISPPNEPIIIKFNTWNFSDQNQLIQQF